MDKPSLGGQGATGFCRDGGAERQCETSFLNRLCAWLGKTPTSLPISALPAPGPSSTPKPSKVFSGSLITTPH